MAFTAKDVQTLRERTGVGMMDCKKALTEADGDMERAVDILREKGMAAAAKKASRIAAEGIVLATYDADKKVGVVVEVNSETDFVAKNTDFQAFVKNVAETIIAKNPADVEALLQATPNNSDQTVAALLQEKVLTIGENIQIRRFERKEGICAYYVHGGGRIGVLLELDTSSELAAKPEFNEFGKDVCMQIAAINPLFLDKASVPQETIDKEKAIMTEQVLNEGKPANIAEKIVAGKIEKYFKENCLLEQAFVKDSDQTVGSYTKAQGDALGGSITLKGFVRFEKGEGLQKREDNFADEVASMIK